MTRWFSKKRSSRKDIGRMFFKRGTSFEGQLGIFGEDPHDIIKKQLKKKDITDGSIEVIEKLLKEFNLTPEALSKFSNQFEKEMSEGLKLRKNNAHVDLKMIPTYVTKLPNGSETGEYLALDLGGTNFRILHLKMNGNPAEMKLESAAYGIAPAVMKSKGNHLFEFIASKVLQFYEEHQLNQMQKYSLGFTFSFPCDQKSIRRGTLVSWTKGFDCPDIVGRDVVSLLQKALTAKGLLIRVSALINDTVGTLMACAYNYPNAEFGMIVGTGTNACYIEKLSNIQNTTFLRCGAEKMIVNMEWGAFGDHSGKLEHMTTEYDRMIDLGSLNPGEQKFEKLISGMYIGEIVRLVICDLYEKRLILEDNSDHQTSINRDMSTLYRPNGLQTKHVSTIEMDTGKTFSKTKEILKELGFPHPSPKDCVIIHFVCRLVSQRAAKLLAGAMAATMRHMGKTELTLGVDGSMYRHHPTFMRNVEYHCNHILDKSIMYSVVLAKDGSGIGAALAAAAATQH